MKTFDTEITSGKICHYCNVPTEYVDSSIIYGKSYGMIYHCPQCRSYVGVHKDSPEISLGRVANYELREMKKRAHFYFDQLWKKAIEEGRSKKKARGAAYKWLADKIGVDRDQCHIGFFDQEYCQRVIDACIPYCKNKIYTR